MKVMQLATGLKWAQTSILGCVFFPKKNVYLHHENPISGAVSERMQLRAKHIIFVILEELPPGVNEICKNLSRKCFW